MRFDNHVISKLRQKYHDVFAVLEQYDKTREWPLGKIRIDITLSKRTVRKLRALKEKTQRPISHLIEEAVEKL